jgi:hypothetical protein
MGIHFCMIDANDVDYHRLERNDTPFIPTPLWAMLRRLDVHCDSDESLWDALTSGCLLDQDPDGQSADGMEIPEWWGPDEPLPTLDSVFAEWEAAWTRAVCLDRIGEEGNDVDIALQGVLRSYLSDIEVEEDICRRVLAQAIDGERGTEVHKSRLEFLVYSSEHGNSL